MTLNQTVLSRYLDTSGDGSGTKNLRGNYATDTFAYVEPPANTVYVIKQLVVTIIDAGAWTSITYGNLNLLAGDGIQVVYTENSNGTILTDLTAGTNVLANTNWNRLTGQHLTGQFVGAANDFMTWTLSFDTAFEPGLILDGDNDETLAVILSDNLGALVGHYFLAKGYSYTTGD